MCETLTGEQLAEKLQVEPRWVKDQARAKNDPIPAFKRGRKRRYFFNCPETKLGRELFDSYLRLVRPADEQIEVTCLDYFLLRHYLPIVRTENPR